MQPRPDLFGPHVPDVAPATDDPSECVCRCHGPESIAHRPDAPCCAPCPACALRVRTGCAADHGARCPGR